MADWAAVPRPPARKPAGCRANAGQSPSRRNPASSNGATANQSIILHHRSTCPPHSWQPNRPRNGNTTRKGHHLPFVSLQNPPMKTCWRLLVHVFQPMCVCVCAWASQQCQTHRIYRSESTTAWCFRYDLIMVHYPDTPCMAYLHTLTPLTPETTSTDRSICQSQTSRVWVRLVYRDGRDVESSDLTRAIRHRFKRSSDIVGRTDPNIVDRDDPPWRRTGTIRYGPWPQRTLDGNTSDTYMIHHVFVEKSFMVVSSRWFFLFASPGAPGAQEGGYWLTAPQERIQNGRRHRPRSQTSVPRPRLGLVGETVVTSIKVGASPNAKS